MERLQKTLENSLKKGGEVLLKYFGNITEISVKQNQSNIVTAADLESEKCIVEIIKQAHPEHNIIGEETGFYDNNSEFTWIVDPLDGTSNFGAGIPWFGVLVALLKNDKPILSGCFLPVQNELYLAEKGKGATMNGKPIKVNSEEHLKNVLIVYSLDFSEDFHKTKQETKIISKLVQNVRNLRATNSLVDFCYVASGRLGGALNQTTCIWDVAAPYLLIHEAGGIATDIAGHDLDFKLTAANYLRNFTIIGSTPSLHPKLLKIVRDSEK